MRHAEYRRILSVCHKSQNFLRARLIVSIRARISAASAEFVIRHYPGRVTCLELSLTAAFRRQRIDWCFGFATDPQAFHSWIEVAGNPVTEPTDDPILPTYRRMFRV